MARGDLTDNEWARLEPLLPAQKRVEPGGQYRDHRQVVNGNLWALRTGAPWRDLPERYGAWQTCYSRFRRWSEQGVWLRALQALQTQQEAVSDLDWSKVALEQGRLDSSSMQFHQGASARGGCAQKGALPSSRRLSKNSAAAGVA